MVSVQALVLRLKRLARFVVVGIGHDAAFDRADFDALRRVVRAHALGALLDVDHVDQIPLRDRFVRALRLAGAAADALFDDEHGHGVVSLQKISRPDGPTGPTCRNGSAVLQTAQIPRESDAFRLKWRPRPAGLPKCRHPVGPNPARIGGREGAAYNGRMAEEFLSEKERLALERLAEDLARVFGPRLRTLVAYEPATAPAARDRVVHSLALVDALSFDDLANMLTVVPAWHKSGLATPLILGRDEFQRTLDVFPIEYGAILARHVVVRGEWPRPAASVADADLRRACERQIKGHLIHLR